MVIDKDAEIHETVQTFHNPHKIDAILFSIATHTFVYRILDNEKGKKRNKIWNQVDDGVDFSSKSHR